MSTTPLAAAERYFQDAMSRLPGLLDTQRPALDRAAALCTDAIAADGLVHLFGCGHSRMMCEEMTPRQGCYVGWHTIVELGLTFHNAIVGPNGLRQSLHLEKTLGYAEQILRNFAFGKKDVLIVSRRAASAKSSSKWPRERKTRPRCDRAAEQGSLRTVETAHPSGALHRHRRRCSTTRSDRRFAADDDGRKNKTGPFSTLGGVMVMNMRCESPSVHDRGIEPVFLPSHQFVGSRSVEDQLSNSTHNMTRMPLYARQG